jgi:hypothetical protein
MESVSAAVLPVGCSGPASRFHRQGELFGQFSDPTSVHATEKPERNRRRKSGHHEQELEEEFVQ